VFRHLFQRAGLFEEVCGAGEDGSFFGKKLNLTGFINRRPLCLSSTGSLPGFGSVVPR
jgi:hypothetical protein